MHWLFQLSCWQDSAEPNLPQQIEEGTPRLHPTTHRQGWGLFIGASAPQCSLHKKERASKVLPKITEEAEETAPEHPSVRTLISATDEAILQVAKQVYWGEWSLAPSMLSHQQHDVCMRGLQQDLNRCIAAIVFSTPENILLGISGAQGMKGSHFLSKHVLWENAVGYLRNSEC